MTIKAGVIGKEDILAEHLALLGQQKKMGHILMNLDNYMSVENVLQCHKIVFKQNSIISAYMNVLHIQSPFI